jgi:hypothetical protein
MSPRPELTVYAIGAALTVAILAYTQEPDMNTLPEWGEYKNARERYELLDAQKKVAYDQMTEAKRRLIDRFEANGWKTGPMMSDGMRASVVSKREISVNQSNSQKVAEWLKKRYGSSEKFATEKLDRYAIRRQLLEELDNEEISPHEIPDFLGFRHVEDVRVEGWDQAHYRQQETKNDDDR